MNSTETFFRYAAHCAHAKKTTQVPCCPNPNPNPENGAKHGIQNANLTVHESNSRLVLWLTAFRGLHSRVGAFGGENDPNFHSIYEYFSNFLFSSTLARLDIYFTFDSIDKKLNNDSSMILHVEHVNVISYNNLMPNPNPNPNPNNEKHYDTRRLKKKLILSP